MLILQNVTAVQFEPALVQGGVDIAIEGALIREVGIDLAARYPQAQVREMQGRLVMPGIVCSHNHFYSGLARGIMARIKPCPDFISTLKNLWWRLDRALDEESLYYSGLVCSLEAIKAGCTAVIDHHASPNYVAGSLDTLRRGFIQAGLRGITCYETTHRNGGEAELQAGVQENMAFARQIDAAKAKGDEPYLVEAMIGAHAPFTISRHGMELLQHAVVATGRGLHIHVAEDRYDVSHGHDVYGQDLIDRLASHQLINHKTLVAHGLYLSDADIQILNAGDAFLVHNPRSNMNNHVGYNDKLAAYRNLALGTDGIGADMLEEARLAYVRLRESDVLASPDTVWGWLDNGYALFPEARADKVTWNYDHADSPWHVAFTPGVRALQVEVDGEVLLRDGLPTRVDLAEVRAKAAEQARRLFARL